MTSLPREHDASSFGDQPLSPLDGRYRAAVAPLSDYLSEAGLNRARVEVEVEWLIALTDRSLFGTAPLEETQKERLRALYRGFGADEIAWLAEKESVTRHDVKASGSHFWYFPVPESGIEALLKPLIEGEAGILSLSIERAGLHDAFVEIAGEAAARALREGSGEGTGQ